jgi:ankyrin repeat protein
MQLSKLFLLALLMTFVGCDQHDPLLTKQLVDASAIGDTQKVTELLLHRANPNGQDGKEGWTPLIAAATRGHEQVILLLLAGKADINRAAIPGTALYAAAAAGNTSCVRLLIRFGAELRINDAQAQLLKRILKEQKLREIEQMLVAKWPH